MLAIIRPRPAKTNLPRSQMLRKIKPKKWTVLRGISPKQPPAAAAINNKPQTAIIFTKPHNEDNHVERPIITRVMTIIVRIIIAIIMIIT